MFKKISTFCSQSLLRQLLFGGTVILSAYSWVLFRFFKRFARFGIPSKTGNFLSKKPNSARLADIRWAIATVAKYVPWQNVCRHQAYQAKLLCDFYNIEYQIFVGFKKGETNQIQGHAWTMAEGLMLSGFCNPEEYVVVQVFFRPKLLTLHALLLHLKTT